MVEIVFLFIITIIAFWDSFNCNYVIDDSEGILIYDGKLQGWNWGYLNRWFWHKIFGKNPRNHHLLSVLLHAANAVLLYTFLGSLFPNNIAFFASLLFAIHPINCQSVSWVSGRGYPLGLFFNLIGLNLLYIYLPSLSTMPLFSLTEPSRAILFGLGIAGYLFLYYCSIEAQFTNMFTFVILALLGFYPLAVLCFGITLVLGIGIIRETITHRADTFKKQNLGESTKLHPKKFVVVCKTLFYYTKLCLFPKRLGLYHVYNYIYTKEKTEFEDKDFWRGFAILITFGVMFYFGNLLVRFGVLWYLSFICIFLNWITIHQFVSERYCYVANIGLCALLAGLLVDVPIVMAVICGILIMRTWVHLPTFQDEIQFYQSNIWNYPNSEVAFANLGVTYMKRGLIGSAMDMWYIGTNINKDYDVAWYNLSSTMKTQGQLHKARDFLKNAVNSPQCHFKEQWSKELVQLEHELDYLKEMDELNKQIEDAKNNPAKIELAKQLAVRVQQVNQTHVIFEQQRKQQLNLVQQELSTMTVRQIQLNDMIKKLQEAIPTDELVKMRDQQWSLVKEDALRLLKGETNANIKP